MKLEKSIIVLSLALGLIRFPLTPILLTQDVFVAYSANLYLIQIVVALSTLGLPELAHDWLSSSKNQGPSALLRETPIAPLFILSSFVSLATVFLLVCLVPSLLPYTRGRFISFAISLIAILSVLQLVLAAIQRHSSSRIAYFLPQLLRSGFFIVLLLCNRNLSLESLLAYELLFLLIALVLSLLISFPVSLRELLSSFSPSGCYRSLQRLPFASQSFRSMLKGIHLSSYSSSLTAAFAANIDKLAASSILPPDLFYQVATMLVPSNLASALTSQLIQVKAKALINIPKVTSLSFSGYLLYVIPQLQLWPLMLLAVPILFSIVGYLHFPSSGLGHSSRFPPDVVLASFIYSLTSVSLIVNMCLYVYRKHSFVLLDGFLAIVSGLLFLSVVHYTSNIALSALIFSVVRIFSSFSLSVYVSRSQASFS